MHTGSEDMIYQTTLDHIVYNFPSLKVLLAKASPHRSADVLAKVSAGNEIERAAAQITLSNVPLTQFLEETLISYEEDEVTRLIFDSHDKKNFSLISHF